ncbi:MAG: PHP domain-containing protein [Fibrobacter sp.]|nr:PHP domain-containing protein [Fibrobacter sp.]
MLQVNSHIHSPYSFSPFDSIAQAVTRAGDENISVLGIKDINSTEGFAEFASACEENGIYPLFNIEFITLNEDDQEKGFYWNDPENPGRIRLCGKGLNHPLFLSHDSRNLMAAVWKGTQDRIWKILGRLNDILKQRQIDIILDYHQIRNLYAKSSVRERHIAKAIYLAFVHRWNDHNKLGDAFRLLFDDQSFSADFADSVLMQNEICDRLLKPGKPAFVEECQSAFLRFTQARTLILEAGGIPSYPVSLEDEQHLNHYEINPVTLMNRLQELKIFAVEFNANCTPFHLLKKYATLFRENGFCVTFGTEHKSPERTSLIPCAKGGREFDEELMQISYEGASIVAAHQERHRQNKHGFVNRQGQRLYNDAHLKDFIRFGDEVIRKFTGSLLKRTI